MKSKAESGNIALEIAFSISSSKRLEFLQTLDSLLSDTAPAAGLSSIGCFEEIGEQGHFLWRECWRSEADLENRLQTDVIKTLMGAIGVLGELERVEVLALTGRAKSSVVWT